MQSVKTVEIPTIVRNEAVKVVHKHTVIIHKCMQKHRENTHKPLHNYTMVGTPSTPPRHIQRGSRKKKKKRKESGLIRLPLLTIYKIERCPRATGLSMEYWCGGAPHA